MLQTTYREAQQECARDVMKREAYAGLVSQFTVAFMSDPNSKPPTPAWALTDEHVSTSTAADIAIEEMSGSEEPLRELLRIVTQVARGEDASLLALSWIAGRAKVYALEQCGDLARNLIDLGERR